MYVIFILNIQKSLYQTPQIEHCSYQNLNTARRGFDYQTSLDSDLIIKTICTPLIPGHAWTVCNTEKYRLPDVYYSMVLLHPVTVQVQVLYHGTPPKIVRNLNDTFSGCWIQTTNYASKLQRGRVNDLVYL